MYEVVVEDSFSAAHYLREYEGNCEKLHGHNWKVQVCVRKRRLNKLGMVVDFRELKKELKKVLSILDHSYLNELAYFKKRNPTTENIAQFIFKKLSAKIKIFSVSVWEAESCFARYRG
jgi:6-pyruvoyltetrahydropterin/6-carboxytetrahydropterin synthase